MDKNSFDITMKKLLNKQKNSREYTILTNRLGKIFKKEWKFREARIPYEVQEKIKEIKSLSIDEVLKNFAKKLKIWYNTNNR